MAGIDELRAMQQGGGAPMPQGGGMGAAMQQKLAQLMQDPVARQAMMQHAQQNGMPGVAQAMAQQGGPPQGGPPQAPPQQAPMPMRPGQEQDMVSQEIDRKGATFDGVEAPTKNDIERLVSDPSSANIKAFDAQFGEGSAEKYLGESSAEDQGESKQQEDTEPDPQGEKY